MVVQLTEQLHVSAIGPMPSKPVALQVSKHLISSDTSLGLNMFIANFEHSKVVHVEQKCERDNREHTKGRALYRGMNPCLNSVFTCSKN